MTTDAPLEFKGRMMGISVLRIFNNDLDELSEYLNQQVNKGGGLLRELPVVIDIKTQIMDVEGLLAVLKKQHINVLAAYRGAASMEAAIRRAGLPVILEQKSSKASEMPAAEVAPEPAPAAEPPPQAPPPASDAPLQTVDSRLVTSPVRSGQRIYARNSDLIITAQVSAGAEVIADGCIHIYGSLRGRAIAGAQGDETARIFCRDMQAEIVAIAGRYKVADDIPEALVGRSAQVSLDGDKLLIDPMN